MWNIARKEWQQFFGSLTGYLAIGLFLLLNGLYLFILPGSNLPDFGYASLQGFFQFVPWVLLFLVPVVTMRSFSDEYRQNTFELLRTWPLSPVQIAGGKMLGGLLVILLSLLPTLIYPVTLDALSIEPGIDWGAAAGSYTGLFLLAAAFVAIGVCASSFTPNLIISFLLGAVVSLLLFAGLESIAQLPPWQGQALMLENLGIRFHYQSLSRGVLDFRAITYFLLLITLAFIITLRNLYRNSTNVQS